MHPVRQSVLPRDLLKTAVGVALVAAAVVVPVQPVFALAVAFVGGIVLCRVASIHVVRVLLFVSTIVVMLAVGAFDRERPFSARRAVSPDGTRVAWLITVDDALHLFVEPLPLRALLGIQRGAAGAIDVDVEEARVVWARDGQSFMVVGRPRSKALWETTRLAWDDDRILGRWDARLPWKWEPLPMWATSIPPWVARLDGAAWTEPVVRVENPNRLEVDAPRHEAFANVDELRVVETEGRAKALLLGRPRWPLLWAEGRLANGEHVLAQQDATTLQWSVLEPWATKTPSWLRAMHDDHRDKMWFAIPRAEKARLCNCTP